MSSALVSSASSPGLGLGLGIALELLGDRFHLHFRGVDLSAAECWQPGRLGDEPGQLVDVHLAFLDLVQDLFEARRGLAVGRLLGAFGLAHRSLPSETRLSRPDFSSAVRWEPSGA